ncbi:MAG: cation:proton antiporter [Candidatus Aenigmarchaeota archaeon]|nr:cation:proton antiporter [Candidatus Aenigmarchaeota archaeon]
MSVLIDPVIPILVIFSVMVLILGIVLRFLKQPSVIAYIVVGVLLGSYGFGVVDESVVSHLGTIGIVLMLFFIGMEVSLQNLVSKWRVAIFGTLFQILFSVFLVWLIGLLFDWPLSRSILVGFVISLSSTAVVLRILQEWGETNSKIGQNILGILLVQDLAIVPMLIILGYMGGDSFTRGGLTLQIVGGLALIGLMAWIINRGNIKLPFNRLIQNDHEVQVFLALVICFGLALLTGVFGLSTALGAFFAGIIVSNARETHWVQANLNPFRTVFVALFFVYIGMLININFLTEHIILVSLLVVAVFLTNTFINSVILKFLGDSWQESLYSGALLSQIGEFSFVLGTVGLQSGIITQFEHNAIIAVISLSLLLSPFWIYLMKHFTNYDIDRHLSLMNLQMKRHKYRF